MEGVCRMVGGRPGPRLERVGGAKGLRILLVVDGLGGAVERRAARMSRGVGTLGDGGFLEPVLDESVVMLTVSPWVFR